MMKITGNIIALNEENRIKACIESLQQVCDEIIVVDSLSSDNTIKIAQDLGAIVISQKYLGDGPQKNIANKHAKNDWVLSIDADERLDDELIKSIKEIQKLEKHPSAYDFKRKNYIGDRWIKHCGWYPNYLTRLYNKNITEHRPVSAHSSICVKDAVRLEGNIIHFSYKNYHDLLDKTNRFSSRGAKIMLANGKQVSGFAPAIHFLAAFFRKYILKRGFLQGLDGLTISLTASIATYMKYAKLLELQRNHNDSTSDSLWEQ